MPYSTNVTITMTGSYTVPDWNNFWTSTASTTSITLNNAIWTSWNTEIRDVSVQTGVDIETEEQAAARREAEAAWQRQRDRERQAYVEQQAAREEAERGALALLLSIVSAAQRREMARFSRVTLRAPSGRVWRVHHGSNVGNLSIMDGDVRRATLCVHPRGAIPLSDVMVGQILAIQYDEERVIAMANLHAGHWSEEEQEIRARATLRPPAGAIHLAA